MNNIVHYFTGAIIILYILVTYLIWKAGGDMFWWLALGTPLVILRLVRAILLIKL